MNDPCVTFITHMSTVDVLPLRLKRSLVQLGTGINVARRRRRLTAQMLAERAGVTRQTFQRVEKGDPTVAIGTYLMVMFILGLDTRGLEHAAEPHADEVGSTLQIAELPRTVRPKRKPQPK